MFLTPPEVQHQTLKSHRGRYDRGEVDKLLEHVASSYEQVWLERDGLQSSVTQLESELNSFRETERYLRDTLVTAQRAAEEVRSEARRDAEKLLSEALGDVGRAKADAERDLEDLRAQIERLRAFETELRSNLRSFLQSALREIDEGGVPAQTLVDALSSEAARAESRDG